MTTTEHRTQSASDARSHRPPCRFCATPLEHTLVDLGPQPLCEEFVPAERANSVEPFFPLHVQVCHKCFLVQLEQYVSPEEIFEEYAYFSAYSDSWVEHARRYAEGMIASCGLGPDSMVVELASNDGYLLQHFVNAGVPSLGVEPAKNVAKAAEERGVPTRVAFFGVEEAEAMVAEGYRADVIAANNVLAQVPDLNDFVAGIKVLLAPEGTATIEFPHLHKLMTERQFDTIYHEHFSYFSAITCRHIFGAHGLSIADIEELPSHGGSLRLHLAHIEEGRAISERAAEVMAREVEAGYERIETYLDWGPLVEATKRDLLRLLIDAKDAGKSIVGYGAPGKGNTLLNYCGIRTDLLDYTVDRNPYKHGRFTPGTRIPIHPPERIAETRPDVILILPWNLQKEIAEQLAYTAEWGAQLVIPIPTATVIS
ncbi:MAG: methyltransferase domain-containing protein [Miltoncostaeaceae bacterium]